MKNILKLLQSEIDFPLRQLFHWQRKGLTLRNEDKVDLFNSLQSSEKKSIVSRVNDYLNKYRLHYLFANSTRNLFLQNLYYLEMLESALKTCHQLPARQIYAADIGVADWFYVHALYGLLKYFPGDKNRDILLDGFEIDAFRVYSDAYSRMDYALAYCRGLENVRFIPKAFSSKPAHYDVIFVLFPFIFIENHLDWGLPVRYFSPLKFIESVWESTKTRGIIIVANQGEEEHQKQVSILKKLGIPMTDSFKFSSPFYSYSLSRYIITIQKGL